jgi:hypothetical protein
MVAVSESMNGHQYGRFESSYVPVRRSVIKKVGLKLPDYLLEDIAP